MDVEQAVTEFLAHRRDKGLSDESMRLYVYWFHLWQSWRKRTEYAPSLASIDAVELRAFFRYLEHDHIPHGSNPRRPAAPHPGMSTAARDSCWRILRAFWNFLTDEEKLAANQLGLFKRDRVPRPQREEDENEELPNRAVDHAMIMALLDVIGPPWTELAARNRALVLMLYDSGMRVSEVCRLDDKHVDLAERTAWVRGKGGKRRFVFWSLETKAALARYLVLRDPTSGPLFLGCSSTNRGLRLTANAVRGTLKRIAKKANVTLPRGAPIHGFRSGFAQRALDEGVDGLDLQQLLGHADIRTTTIYTRRHPTKLRAVHRRIVDRGIADTLMGRRRGRIT